MNRRKLTTIAHRDHPFCNPVSSERVDDLLSRFDLAPGDSVLDVGCGKGEMLIRLIERYGIKGVGVDPNAEFLAEARERAAGRIEEGSLELHAMDIARRPLDPASFDAAICAGSTHAFVTYRGTLRSLARVVRPGGSILVGEGYWKADPHPGYLAVLGATRAEFTDHEGNLAIASEEGLSVLHASISSDEEWDAYESLYASTIEDYSRSQPEDPDSGPMLAHSRRWLEAYRRWGRQTLGFALYLFENRRPSGRL